MTYLYEELRAVIPVTNPAPLLEPQAQPMTDAIPLIKLLAIHHRELVECGISQGGRNDAGAKLVRDLIGCERWAQQAGIQVDSSAKALLFDFGARCNPPLSESETMAIYRSADKSDPTPCLSGDKLIACVAAELNKQKKVKCQGIAKSTKPKASDAPIGDASSKVRVSLSWDEDYTPETLAALEQMNQEYAVIKHNPQGIWDVVGGKPLNAAHFRLIMKNKKGQYWIETNDGKRLESKPLAALWESWSQRREHDEVDLLPKQPTTQKTLNLWQGWGAVLLPDAEAPLWKRHLDVLFGLTDWDGSPLPLTTEQTQQRRADRDWFERWLAYPIQHPGVKLRTMVLIWSRNQGIGKTTVADLMQGLYGQHFLEVESRFFETGFNGPLVGKLLVSAEEVFCDGRFTFMDRLKSLVTSERIGINVKHGAQYEAVNRFNLLATSNHSNALHLDDQDRRVFVHEVLASHPPDGYFKRLFDWGKSQAGKNSLFTHLRSLDLGNFDPYAGARVTEAKLRMIDNSRSDLDRWISELEYSDLPDVVELKTLLPKARDACPSTRLQSNTLSAALHKAGFETRRMTPTYQRAQLVAIRNREVYRIAENAYWGKHWQDFTVSPLKINSSETLSGHLVTWSTPNSAIGHGAHFEGKPLDALTRCPDDQMPLGKNFPDEILTNGDDY